MGSISKLGGLTFTGLSGSSLSTPTKHIPPQPPVEDQVQIASIPSSAEVEQLQSTSPSSFQAVVSDSIRMLRTAAFQSTDPVEAEYLSGLADRFQRMQEDGQASAPSGAAQTPSSSGAPS
jgi:hypothetical protein